ncbi:hypothetical protein PUN28_020892 [Cardiocondyla obscurior]|uniref:Uncharacterized protein n=1 Tax=Cardiocondyla obscurior TaxID=286306 RepID=A0AAW2E5I8_9HYME
MAKKRNKIFLKFGNITLCIRTYSEPSIFTSSRDMANERKKILLKFNNIALCGIKNGCIRAYSELFIFIRSRDMAKKRKKYFEILQRSIVRHLKKILQFSPADEIWPKNKIKYF